jgi:2,3-bisphosphoglycerate-dependent phosphoglycerate mutase
MAASVSLGPGRLHSMQIVLVRHGEPEWVRDGLNIDDPPLTERGAQQARRLAHRLGQEHFDEILVSPLLRARQTAAPLLARLGRHEEIDPWLEEIRNPVWHGTPAEKAEAAFAEERSRAPQDQWRGIPGGEDVGAFVARIREGIGLFLAERGVEPAREDLPTWHLNDPALADRRILFISHAGTSSVSLCHVLGLTPVPWEWERFSLAHASVTRLQSFPVGGEHTFSLVKLSDVEHLPQELRST